MLLQEAGKSAEEKRKTNKKKREKPFLMEGIRNKRERDKDSGITNKGEQAGDTEREWKGRRRVIND